MRFSYPAAFLVVAALAATGLAAEQTPGTPPEAARREDSYAVYSKLLSRFSSLLLIEDMTLGAREISGPPDLSNSKTRGPAIGEIAADYNARKDASAKLEQRFGLDSRNYRLIRPDEGNDFLGDRRKRNVGDGGRNPGCGQPPPDQADRFPCVKPPEPDPPLFPADSQLIRLGDVFFNKDRTAAVVYYQALHDQSNGEHGWIAFIKTGEGRWEENPAWGMQRLGFRGWP